MKSLSTLIEDRLAVLGGRGSRLVERIDDLGLQVERLVGLGSEGVWDEVDAFEHEQCALNGFTWFHPDDIEYRALDRDRDISIVHLVRHGVTGEILGTQRLGIPMTGELATTFSFTLPLRDGCMGGRDYALLGRIGATQLADLTLTLVDRAMRGANVVSELLYRASYLATTAVGCPYWVSLIDPGLWPFARDVFAFRQIGEPTRQTLEVCAVLKMSDTIAHVRRVLPDYYRRIFVGSEPGFSMPAMAECLLEAIIDLTDDGLDLSDAVAGPRPVDSAA